MDWTIEHHGEDYFDGKSFILVLLLMMGLMRIHDDNEGHDDDNDDAKDDDVSDDVIEYYEITCADVCHHDHLQAPQFAQP